VLIGTTGLYFGLHEADSDIADLFKVGAEFAASMPRTNENEQLYARFIATVAAKEQLLPFDREAVARIVEHSSRLTADSQRLSTFFLDVTDLLRESDYWARRNDQEIVRRLDVIAALDARMHRADLSRDRMIESYAREIMLIDVEGEHLGRVNGLTVLTRGDFSFGMPVRISARVRMGSGMVMDIEREVSLSGPFHSKGVLILAGYLGGRYVPNDELAIAASLTFEQSYSAIDGDSASSTELYALLSALSGLPISQSFAVTGSVNQHGQVQAIGGVNEKIEGFFDVCKKRGWTGKQGVLIPTSNVQHLMLRKDIVQAVADGSFAVYPIATIDEGIAVLTGVEAGEADARGYFPADSVNGLVQVRLRSFAERRYARLGMVG
jgi:lon-related putative ATP-dependent protease